MITAWFLVALAFSQGKVVSEHPSLEACMAAQQQFPSNTTLCIGPNGQGKEITKSRPQSQQ